MDLFGEVIRMVDAVRIVSIDETDPDAWETNDFGGELASVGELTAGPILEEGRFRVGVDGPSERASLVNTSLLLAMISP